LTSFLFSVVRKGGGLCFFGGDFGGGAHEQD
jgi:hypothetical protein